MEHCTLVDLYHIVTLSIFKDCKTIIQVTAIALIYTVSMEYINEYINSKFSRVMLCTRKLSRSARFALAWLQFRSDNGHESPIKLSLEARKVMFEDV